MCISAEALLDVRDRVQRTTVLDPATRGMMLGPIWSYMAHVAEEQAAISRNEPEMPDPKDFI